MKCTKRRRWGVDMPRDRLIREITNGRICDRLYEIDAAGHEVEVYARRRDRMTKREMEIAAAVVFQQNHTYEGLMRSGRWQEASTLIGLQGKASPVPLDKEEHDDMQYERMSER